MRMSPSTMAKNTRWACSPEPSDSGAGHRTFLDLAPADSHQSVGAIERANRDIAWQALALKLSLGTPSSEKVWLGQRPSSVRSTSVAKGGGVTRHRTLGGHLFERGGEDFSWMNFLARLGSSKQDPTEQALDCRTPHSSPVAEPDRAAGEPDVEPNERTAEQPALPKTPADTAIEDTDMRETEAEPRDTHRRRWLYVTKAMHGSVVWANGGL